LTRGRRLNLAAIIEKAITGIAGFIIPSEVLQNQPLLLGMDTQLGGGHILHLLCDISIASENAKFGQAGPEVGSFDAGFGASFLARCLGEKKAFNADTDHQWGFDEMSGAAVRLYWATGEAEEAKEAFSEERKPNFSKFRK
jgi:1,4-dihydroxy-2-naphthoyl-CoA synthase